MSYWKDRFFENDESNAGTNEFSSSTPSQNPQQLPSVIEKCTAK